MKNKSVLMQPKQGGYFSSSEMGPNIGQTRPDVSVVVSLVSGEPEGLAPVTRGERPSKHSRAYGAGRLRMADMAA